MNIDKKITDDLVANDISFVTTVPCKQLAGVIDEIDRNEDIFHIPSNKEDEGMGQCAGAFMGGKRPAIIWASAGRRDMRGNSSSPPATKPARRWQEER